MKHTHISDLSYEERPEDVYILGNGPSLASVSPYSLSGRFTIGTNRTWLWGSTHILIWRDARITEELQFFAVEKRDTKWIASADKSFDPEQLIDVSLIAAKVDHVYDDRWMNGVLGTRIRWNGIIFHALALARHIAPDATFHLVGVDLMSGPGRHHFFAEYPGFDSGFYKTAWDEDRFHFQKRLDMMMSNFRRLEEKGISIVNHSRNSRLTELFGYEELPGE